MKLLVIFFCLISHAFGNDWPPSYRYQVLTSDKTTSTVTKESFEFIPALVLSLTSPEISKRKLSVEIRSDWVKPYFTAWASHEGTDKFAINFWGGLARIPGMNDEAFALTACHELGHILGGTPRIKIKEFLWSSAEGQSDYYAAGVCLKTYFLFMNKLKKLTIPKDIPETSFTLCRTSYSEETDFLVCLNISKGIMGFANMLKHLNGHSEDYHIETPSRKKVALTIYDSYPEQQCRIDTLFQASLCPLRDFPCEGKKPGARPDCWFR